MNSKFYVSPEAEELLKEKGCDIKEEIRIFNEYGDVLGVSYDDGITKAEAIDWLDSKGIFILLYMYSIISEDYTIKACWGYNILRGDELLFTDNSSNTPTRLEAEEAAIIKTLELL